MSETIPQSITRAVTDGFSLSGIVDNPITSLLAVFVVLGAGAIYQYLPDYWNAIGVVLTNKYVVVIVIALFTSKGKAKI